MANRYWIGNSGSWNDTAHWSASSGGGGGASVPTENDNVFIDANSFSANGHVISLVTPYAFSLDFDCQAATKTFEVALTDASGAVNVDLVIRGHFRLNNKVTFTENSTTGFRDILLSAKTAAVWQIDANGATINPRLALAPGFAPSATYELISPLVLNTTGSVTSSSIGWFLIQAGNFTTNNHNVTAAAIYPGGGSSNWGTSTVTCDQWLGVSSHIQSSSNLTINFVNQSATILNHFAGAGKTFGTVNFNHTAVHEVDDSNTFTTLSFAAGAIVEFAENTTQTLTNFIANGTAGNLVTIRSMLAGTRFSLSKSSGSVTEDYLNIKDSAATGGATWWAGDNSVNSGNNTGWIFSDIIYEREIVEDALGDDEAALFFESAEYDISDGDTGRGLATYLTAFQPLPQKDYEYRVFDEDWNFVAVLAGVYSDFGYSQALNQNASELTIKLARSPENRVVTYLPLLDHLGNNITDENGDNILVQTETENAVGEGTDIQENFNVDVYAFYGGYEQLLDHNSEPILDETGDPILVQFGQPNGKRVYSGYIADYELVFGSPTGVEVLLVPHATEMSHYIFKADNGNTTVSYLNTDPVLMARDAMDDYNDQGGLITYSTNSMPLSGTDTDYDFKLQTTREAIDKTIELLPSGYYHYPHPGENVQYLLQKEETAHHTFYYKKHISELRLRKSITQLVNDVYVVGGDTGAGDLFKHYEDAPSQASYRRGLARIADSRVTLETSADILGTGKIDTFKEPRWRTQVRITDAVYDIESISLGEMVGFKNFGNYIDSLVLQIVNIKREKHAIVMDLDMLVPDDTKRLEELKKAVQSEEIRDIGDAPS